MNTGDITLGEIVDINEYMRGVFRDCGETVTAEQMKSCSDTVVTHLKNVFTGIQDGVSEEIEFEDEQVNLIYLGTVFSLMPSGKLWAVFTTNQTVEDVAMDSTFIRILEGRGILLISGEGSSADVYVMTE